MDTYQKKIIFDVVRFGGVNHVIMLIDFIKLLTFLKLWNIFTVVTYVLLFCVTFNSLHLKSAFSLCENEQFQMKLVL